MNKYKKCEILILFLIASLLLITPFLPSSSRPTYLYFIFNVLIIALGAEAGLLSVFSKPPPENITNNQHYSSSLSQSITKPVMVTTQDQESSVGNNKTRVIAVEKSASEKFASVKMVDDEDNKLKKCASMPSIFFIGDEDDPQNEVEEEVVVDDVDGGDGGDGDDLEVVDEKVLSGQELFTKAENFIGNFYLQLKMQREESWKKIHGLYQTAY